MAVALRSARGDKAVMLKLLAEALIVGASFAERADSQKESA